MSETVERLKRKIERLKQSQAEAEKLLEEKSRELYDLNKSLEKQVDERTLELKKSRDEAILATKSKDRFLARMSHEIRTPLNGIIGILDLLNKTTLTQEQRSFVKISSESGSILLSIINDILEYSKITAGKAQLEVQEFDIEKSIESVAEILSYKVFEKGLDLIIDISDDSPRLFKSDEQKFRQILINLIGNSIKFTPNGEIEIKLLSNKDGALVEVRDTGIGVPKEKIHSIFDSFTQADANDTRKYGGSGLGLAICKNFVEMLGGHISVESKDGVGTTFRFTLKNHLQAAPVPQEPPPLNAHVILNLNNKSLEKILSRHLEHWKVKYQISKPLSDISSNEDSSHPLTTHLILDHHLISKNWAPSKDIKTYILGRHEDGKEINEKYPDAQFLLAPLSRKKLLDLLTDEKEAALSIEKEDLEKKYEQEEPILLVEDNLINQKVAQHILSSAGYTCDIANNGQEAVEMASSKFYRIIFMDYNMPIMDGVEATKHIRHLQEDSRKKSHIIAMTASAMKETREKCAEAGMDDFITKPVKPDEISHRIEKILAQKKE